MISDNSRGADQKTVAGILALIDSDLTGYGEYCTPWHLFEFIRIGLFERDGQHVMLTEFGHDTYDAGYEPTIMREAA